MSEPRRPGPIALVGSGEYLEVMEETDRRLLDAAGGPARARVVVLPTAAGLEEPGSPARWIRMGIEHFSRLGAQVEAAPILSQEAAHDPQWLAILEAADFFYFSGGNPQHLIGVMAGSPAWEVIRRRHQEGAVLAGCSAGAMAICGRTAARLRTLGQGELPEWMPALGVLPRLIALPHFDRMASFIGREAFTRVVRAVPDGVTLLGVDEDTALVRLDATPDEQGRTRWRVMGRQTVSLYLPGRADPAIFGAGEQVALRAE
jgi:cyanophycinase